MPIEIIKFLVGSYRKDTKENIRRKNLYVCYYWAYNIEWVKTNMFVYLRNEGNRNEKKPNLLEIIGIWNQFQHYYFI